MVMCAFLFALWLILNGRITVEICLIGFVITAGVYAFCVRFLGYSPRHEKGLFKRIWLYIVYFFVLVWEIIKANLSVMKVILLPEHKYHAAIVRVKVPFKRDISRVLLANSITLTPGTVTVEQKGDDFRVLCLQKESAGELPTWRLTKLLHKMEDETWN